MDNIETLIVLSGGGSLYGWQSTVLNGLADAGIRPSMIGSTSTGTIGAFMFSKGLIKEGYDLCDEVYSNNARAITKPGIASISNGKLKINWLKALSQLAFNKNKIVSLMDNSPLAELLTKIDTEHPGFEVPIFYNVVDMRTGSLVEYSTKVEMSQKDRIDTMVASTTIPVVWPLIGGIQGDGGIKEGTALSAMFARTQPGKKYRIIVISCNNTEMAQYEDLNRIDRIAGRTASIVLNEMLINDLGRTQDRNEVAKAIEEHRHELPAEFLRKLPYNYAPIYIIEYKGPSGTFSFTPESLKEQRESAKETVSLFLESIKNQERVL